MGDVELQRITFYMRYGLYVKGEFWVIKPVQRWASESQPVPTLNFQPAHAAY